VSREIDRTFLLGPNVKPLPTTLPATRIAHIREDDLVHWADGAGWSGAVDDERSRRVPPLPVLKNLWHGQQARQIRANGPEPDRRRKN
jgi:hypothetical protein